MDTKESLRLKMKKLRRDYPDKAKASAEITERILSLPEYSAAKCVCVYMASFGEPDTDAVIKSCFECGKSVVIPVSGSDGTLKLSLTDGKFKKGLYGIREPQNPIYTDFSVPDLIIVPGLCFDIKGNRIGFGMGYYDRFLKNARGFKAGICYDFQILDDIPCCEHDIKLDALICSSKIYRF